jgi:hypothetical protein
MRRLISALALCAGLLAGTSGCTVHRDGSQAITFNPFAWGSSEAAVQPADGPGYDNGVPLDQR